MSGILASRETVRRVSCTDHTQAQGYESSRNVPERQTLRDAYQTNEGVQGVADEMREVVWGQITAG